MGLMTGMTPHTVTRVRPVISVNSAGEDVCNYVIGSGSGDPSGVSIEGLVQLRAAAGSRLKEGFNATTDGAFYTDSSGMILPNDMLIVSGQVITADFLVLQASDKSDLDGNYDHTECILKEVEYGSNS